MFSDEMSRGSLFAEAEKNGSAVALLLFNIHRFVWSAFGKIKSPEKVEKGGCIEIEKKGKFPCFSVLFTLTYLLCAT